MSKNIRLRTTIVFILAIVLAFSYLSLSPTTVFAASSINVDQNTIKQDILGFGACPYGEAVTNLENNFSANDRNAFLDKLLQS